MQNKLKYTRKDIRKLKSKKIKRRKKQIIKSVLKGNMKNYFVILFVFNFTIIHFIFRINMKYSIIYTLGIDLFSLWMISVAESKNKIQEESQKIRNTKIELK